jgi:putative redox protein
MGARQRIRFEGATGATLVGIVEHPQGRPRGRALFAHCFTCSKDFKAAVRISRTLADAGFLVLRFDFTGLGESEGDFAGTDFSSNLEDLVAAADALRDLSGPPDLLVGHSLGGAAVLAAAARIPDAKAVATLGAPSDLGHLREQLLARAPELETDENAVVELAGRSIRVGRQLIRDLAENRLLPSLAELGRPLLIFHSPVDQVVDVDHARRIFKAARHPKSFVSLDGADHLLLAREEDSVFVGTVLAAWAGRYLTTRDGDRAGEAADHEDVVLVEIGRERYRTTVRSGPHRLVADEPVGVGGGDRGPTPYGLLLAALGACKAITLRMYADRKAMGLESVRLALRHERLHAKDCEECSSESGRVDRVDVELELDGDLDESQRQRLLEISGRCPVHQTLVSETVVRSSLVAEASTLSSSEDDPA